MPSLDARLVHFPFLLHVSPYASDIEDHVQQWASSFGLIGADAPRRRFVSARFGWYASAAQPEASFAALSTYAEFIAWLFLVNDQHGEGLYATPDAWNDAVLPLHRVLAAGETTGIVDPSPAARALASILQDVYRRMSDDWRTRFTRHCSEVLHAACPESRDRRAGRVPGTEKYIANRRIVSAGAPMLDLSEYCGPSELPGEIYNLPQYQEMRAAASDIMAWTNDIVSLEKEISAKEVHNLVLVLEHHHGLSRSGALDRVTTWILDRVDDLTTAERSLVRHVSTQAPDDSYSAAIHYVVRSVRHFVVGHALWANNSPRYVATAPADIEDLLRNAR